MATGHAPVGVLVRVRPNPSSRPPVLAVHPETDSVTLPQNRIFTFNAVYGSESTQSQIWEAVENVVDGVLDGFNGTILAYGQTSSGKTYTMLGPDWELEASSETYGVIPRAVQYIFARIQEAREQEPDFEYGVSVSFLEIYQEQVRDLLVKPAETSGVKELIIRQNKFGAMSVCGLMQVPVADVSKALSFLQQGIVARTTGDTHMNENSSRSHAVFTITLEQRTSAKGNEGGRIQRISKLSLVDLAGSERLKRTGAEGIRFKESVKINTGLLALGNVISILSTDAGQGRYGHVPYRESKLTRLLEDSLGGNAKTVMIACVSPGAQDLDETLNTLKYAHRARKIKNRPVVNIVPHYDEPLPAQEQSELIIDSKPNGEAAEEAGYTTIDEGASEEDDIWVREVVQELKARTGKGLRAQKELEIATHECRSLHNRIEDLERSLQDAQLVIAELHSTSEESDEHHAKQMGAYETHVAALEQDLQNAHDDRDSLTARVKELEQELSNFQNNQSILTTDINVTVDTLIAVMNGEDVARVGEDAKGVVRKWRPDSAICVESSGGPRMPNDRSFVDKDASQRFVSRPPSSASTTNTTVIQRRRVRKVSLPDQTTASLIDRQHAAIRRLEDELFDKEAETKTLQAELQRFKTVIVPRMESVNSGLILENNRLKSELEGHQPSNTPPRAEPDHSQMLSEIAVLKAENERLQREMSKMVPNGEVMSENEQLQLEVRRLIAALATATDKNDDTTENEELRQDVEAIRLECSKQVDLRTTAEDRVKQVCLENINLKKEMDRMRHELDAWGKDPGPTQTEVTESTAADHRPADEESEQYRGAAEQTENAQKFMWPENPLDLVKQISEENERLIQAQLDASWTEDDEDASERSFVEKADNEEADVNSRAVAGSPDRENTDDEDEFPVHVSEIHETRPPILSPLPQTAETPPQAVPASSAQMRRELATANRAKVEIMRELRDAHKEMERIRHSTSHQTQKITRELEFTRGELAKMTAAVEERDAALIKLKDENERKTKLTETHMSKLKTRVKELQKSVNDKEGFERKCAELKDEVARADHKIAALKKKLRDESDKLTELETKKAKETGHLKKQHDEDLRRIKVLEAQIEVLKKKLDRSAGKISAAPAVATVAPFSDSKAGEETRRSTRALPDGTPSIPEADVHADELNLVEQVEDMQGLMSNRAEEMETFKNYHALSKHLRQVRAAVSQLTSDLTEGESILADLPHDDPMRKQVEDRVAQLRHEREKGIGEADRVAKEREIVERRLKELEREKEQAAHPEEKDGGTANKPNHLNPHLTVSRTTQTMTSTTIPHKLAPQISVDTQSTQTDPHASAPPNAATAKDVAHYRKTIKDLKSTLREIVTVNHKLAAALEKERNCHDRNPVPVIAPAVPV